MSEWIWVDWAVVTIVLFCGIVIGAHVGIWLVKPPPTPQERDDE